MKYHLRTIIMTKPGMIGAIGLYFDEHTAQVSRIDLREDGHTTSIFDSPQLAINGFANMIRVSQANGWRKFYDGSPNYG